MRLLASIAEKVIYFLWWHSFWRGFLGIVYPKRMLNLVCSGCGHCKNLKPEYERAAASLSSLGQVILAAVDCTESASLCKEAGVEGYPTLKYYSYYNKGQLDYDGGRKVRRNAVWPTHQADNLKGWNFGVTNCLIVLRKFVKSVRVCKMSWKIANNCRILGKVKDNFTKYLFARKLLIKIHGTCVFPCEGGPTWSLQYTCLSRTRG